MIRDLLCSFRECAQQNAGRKSASNLTYRVLADFVVTFHAAYVVFVVLGALLALKWPKVLWIHAPAAIWGVLIEYAGWICPLTPLENDLRARAGEAGYSGDFIEHYILRALYPHGLTPSVRYVLGTFALLVNVAAYTIVLRRIRRRRSQEYLGSRVG